MSQIGYTVSGGTPPYTISVKKENEGFERYISWNGTTLSFQQATDNVLATYYIRTTDSVGTCIKQDSFQLQCAGSGGGENPDFNIAIFQPACNANNTFTDGYLQLTGIKNATRYKICYNSSSFNCGGDCSQSDGFIGGNNTNISIPAPPAETNQTNTLRVYADAGCTRFKDFTFSMYTRSCTLTGILIFDLRFFSGSPTQTVGTDECRQNIQRDFESYFTLNTPGVAENGQRAITGSGSEKNVPNGNDVPNVMIVASPGISCGPAAFYRHQINTAYLKSKYPGINLFTFDLYARVTLGGANINVTITKSQQKGVRMVSKPIHTGCGGTAPAISDFTDAGRDPCDRAQESGGIISEAFKEFTINAAAPTFVKIKSLQYNYTTDQLTVV